MWLGGTKISVEKQEKLMESPHHNNKTNIYCKCICVGLLKCSLDIKNVPRNVLKPGKKWDFYMHRTD